MDNKIFDITVSTAVKTYISLKTKFSLQVDEHDTKFLPVKILVTDEENQVAHIEVFIIDRLIYSDPKYMIELGDDLDAEFQDALKDLIGSASFRKLQDDGFCNIGYISRFYVMPHYRCQGIGQYLLENLESILEETIGFDIGCFLAFICPLSYENGKWEHKVDDNMKSLMNKLFKRNGFKRIKGSDNIIKFLY